MFKRKVTVLLATCVAALAFTTAAFAEYVGASPGVYARSSTSYNSGFAWTRTVGGDTYKYSWYIYTSGGTLQASGIGVTYGHATWTAGYNYRYWKFYNSGSNPGVQGFDVVAQP